MQTIEENQQTEEEKHSTKHKRDMNANRDRIGQQRHAFRKQTPEAKKK